MKETWGFLNSGFHDAATNMAIDETLLNWHSEGKIPPIIRFYGWDKPSLSVGHSQNEKKSIDIESIHKHGCHFVRRLTGGSAVLHDHEVTYSMIVNESHSKIPHAVNEAYYVLADGLLRGYQNLGIEATFASPQQESGDNRSAVCFETPAIYEILAGGKKLSGNAQARRKGVLLQHGSLPISYDAAMLFDLFRFSSAQRRNRQQEQFFRKATSIHEQMEEKLEFDDLVPVFHKGMKDSLDIETEGFEVTADLWKEVLHLRDTKYSTNTWNHKQKRGKTGSEMV